MSTINATRIHGSCQQALCCVISRLGCEPEQEWSGRARLCDRRVAANYRYPGRLASLVLFARAASLGVVALALPWSLIGRITLLTATRSHTVRRHLQHLHTRHGRQLQGPLSVSRYDILHRTNTCTNTATSLHEHTSVVVIVVVYDWSGVAACLRCAASCRHSRRCRRAKQVVDPFRLWVHLVTVESALVLRCVTLAACHISQIFRKGIPGGRNASNDAH